MPPSWKESSRRGKPNSGQGIAPGLGAGRCVVTEDDGKGRVAEDCAQPKEKSGRVAEDCAQPKEKSGRVAGAAKPLPSVKTAFKQ